MDGTPFLKKEPKRYICDRLFGGPMDRKRTGAAHSPGIHAIDTLSTGVTIQCWGDYSTVPKPRPTIRYTKRRAGFGPGKMVTYFADSRLSDAEAADRFFTYLLDRSCIERDHTQLIDF